MLLPSTVGRVPKLATAVSPCGAMPKTRTAMTPSSGGLRRMSRRFAVGKPNVRPNSLPCTTRPSIR